jgi:hypothetical protein
MPSKRDREPGRAIPALSYVLAIPAIIDAISMKPPSRGLLRSGWHVPKRAERGQFISQFISDDDVVGIQLDIEQCLEIPDLPQQVRDVLGLAHNVLTAILSGARMLSASQVRLKSPPPV